jgi:hypothetical protein
MEDALARGHGGFTDRHHLAQAALDEYLLELAYCGQATGASQLGVDHLDHWASGGETSTAPVRGTAGQKQETVPSQEPSGRSSDSEIAGELEFVLPDLARGVASLDRLSALRDEPLLGLHNRDWPSLWALAQLARVAFDGPVPLRQFLAHVTSRAWELGDALSKSTLCSTEKLTALLPTNQSKPQSAEDAFRAFAIASIARRPDSDGRYTVTGPLPSWRAIGLTENPDDGLLVGVTDAGWDLLELVKGLSPATPHTQQTAEAFLAYLKRHAPTDWWGFAQMLQTVRARPLRLEYIDSFRRARQWTESVAVSTAQGYLARAREWGLVKSKMINGRYELTGFGDSMANLAFAS